MNICFFRHKLSSCSHLFTLWKLSSSIRTMNVVSVQRLRWWWAQMDSNHRPRAYQARALTTWAMSPYSYGSLSPLFPWDFFSSLVEMMGFEPMTPCLQGRCSPNWATPPYLYEAFAFVVAVFFCVFAFFFFRMVPENRTTKKRFLTQSHWVCPISNVLWKIFFQSLAFSIERRWSSRTFRYGYLVTT